MGIIGTEPAPGVRHGLGVVSVELRRYSVRGIRRGIATLVCGLAIAFVPDLLTFVVTPPGPPGYLRPILSGAGALVIAAAACTLAWALRPLRLRMDVVGLTVRTSELRTTLEWESLAAVSIERLRRRTYRTAPHLVFWPADGVHLGAKPNYRRDGRPGYALVRLDDLNAASGDVVAAFRRLAGDRFTADLD